MVAWNGLVIAYCLTKRAGAKEQFSPALARFIFTPPLILPISYSASKSTKMANCRLPLSSYRLCGALVIFWAG
jgi:hypothetical protein